MWLIVCRAGHYGVWKASHHGGLGCRDAGVGEDRHVLCILTPKLCRSAKKNKKH